MPRLLTLLIVALLSGCVNTTYRNMDANSDSKNEDTPFSQAVVYRIADTLYEQSPDCVIVGPTHKPAASNIEAAVARHVSERFSRVIGPMIRDRKAREWAFDLRNSDDRRAFSRKLKCSYWLEISALHKGRDYFVVWSQQRFSLALSLSSIHEEHTLWIAQHTASRSRGGLALSPISAAVNAAEAGFHQSSHDVATSLIDDVLRRMIVTLPDFR